MDSIATFSVGVARFISLSTPCNGFIQDRGPQEPRHDTNLHPLSTPCNGFLKLSTQPKYVDT